MNALSSTPFTEFLNAKFIDWQKSQIDQGSKRLSLSAFAEWLNESQPTVSAWMNGRYAPSHEKAHNLAKHLGIEVYESLGLDKPSEHKLKLERLVDQLTEDQQDQVLQLMEKLAARNKKGREAIGI